MEEKTISEKLDRLLDSFEQIQVKKKFKLPFGIRTQRGKLKKNYAVVEIIRTNGNVDFKFVQIEDNTVKIGDIYYETTAKHVLRYGKYPLIILPEWNISPLSKPEEQIFSSEKNLDEAVKEGKLSAAEKFILHAIKMDLVKEKPKINFTTIIIIIAVLGGLALVLNYKIGRAHV